jgi:hypothetical protein
LDFWKQKIAACTSLPTVCTRKRSHPDAFHTIPVLSVFLTTREMSVIEKCLITVVFVTKFPSELARNGGTKNRWG